MYDDFKIHFTRIRNVQKYVNDTVKQKYNNFHKNLHMLNPLYIIKTMKTVAMHSAGCLAQPMATSENTV